MSASLLDTLSGLVTPDLISKAATALGDNPSAVTKGVGAVLPVLLGSVANRASDTGFASQLFNLVRDPANDGSLLGNLGSLLAPGASSSPMMGLGGKLLSSLFGNNLGSLGSAIANYAGVKPSTASSLLSFGAPLLLSILGKAVQGGNLNAASLASLLLGQKSSIAAALPPALSRVENYFAMPAGAAAAPPPAESKSSVTRWLIPLIIALAALWLLSRCMAPKEKQAEMTPAPAPTPAEAAPATAAPTAALFFDVDKTDLPADASATLAPVIAYLQANSAATAVVSGYHDPTGDLAHNEELAKNRAEAVKATLVAAGIAESRIDMQKPIVTTGGGTNADARRVEVSVR